MNVRLTRIPSFLRHVGPGVVAGAADDDPSGIATYTQAGAQFGTGVLWTVLLVPFMIAIQLVGRPANAVGSLPPMRSAPGRPAW